MARGKKRNTNRISGWDGITCFSKTSVSRRQYGHSKSENSTIVTVGFADPVAGGSPSNRLASRFSLSVLSSSWGSLLISNNNGVKKAPSGERKMVTDLGGFDSCKLNFQKHASLAGISVVSVSSASDLRWSRRSTYRSTFA